MNECIVVACYGLGTEWHRQCAASLEPYLTADRPALYVDTSAGGHPTGAYIRTYQQTDFDRYLFIQDSMTAIADPLPWFREQWQGAGAVAWGQFGMAWDSPEQRQRVLDQYGDHDHPRLGVFGPVFYTDRASLDKLAAADLLPWVPRNRLDAQGTERGWAYAFHRAGMPVAGPLWSHAQMQLGFGPFKKVWAGRP